MSVLIAKNAGYRYSSSADRWACRGIDMIVEPGDCVALLGPNGAGKTTFVSMVAGFMPPTEGEIRLLGGSPRDYRVRRHLGLTPQDSAFPKTVRVREVIRFVLAQYDRPLNPELIEALRLQALWDKLLSQLSGGERRRVGLACALCAEPELIVLDEPTTGLDLESRHSLFEFLKRLAKVKRRSILFSTHHMDEVESLPDRVVVFNKGIKIREASVEAIRTELGFKRIRFRRPANLAAESSWIVREAEGFMEILVAQPEPVLKRLLNEHSDLEGLEVHAASLEEAFLHLVERQ